MEASIFAQRASAGGSSDEIHSLALSRSRPQPGLSWLDIGCGTGTVLREVRTNYEPASLIGVDVIDWLADSLRGEVEMHVGPAERELPELDPVDRVLMVEVLEHLDSPWSVLRAAAALVAPGGRIVITTPSITNLRSRAELLLRGRLTSFRQDNQPHLTPALPHVVKWVLGEAGLRASIEYGARDIIPLTGGKLWPRPIHAKAPRLTSVSVVVTAERP